MKTAIHACSNGLPVFIGSFSPIDSKVGQQLRSVLSEISISVVSTLGHYQISKFLCSLRTLLLPQIGGQVFETGIAEQDCNRSTLFFRLQKPHTCCKVGPSGKADEDPLVFCQIPSSLHRFFIGNLNVTVHY